MSEEEKLTKKQKIEDNRRLRAMSQNSSMFSFTPSSSPPIVPETERFNFSIEYKKRIINDDDDGDYEDNKDNIHLFDDNNYIKSTEDIYSNNVNQYLFDYKTLLNDHNQVLLTKIDENYTRAVQLNVSVIRGYDFPCLRNLNDIIDVVNEPAQMSSLRLITFLKLTPEFNVRFFFIKKKNLLCFFFYSLCMKMIDLH
jgi:hypothetical protein